MSSQHTSSIIASAVAPTRYRLQRLGCGPVRRSGMTLIEVMIGMTVVGTACLAGLSGMLFTLRVADSNLRAITAASAVRAVSEQLYSLDYETLFASSLPADVPSNPGGSLVTNTWNVRTDDVHNTPGDPQDDLQMRINPAVTRVQEAGGLDYALVVIQYEWQDSAFFVPRTRSDSLAMIVSMMSSY